MRKKITDQEREEHRIYLERNAKIAELVFGYKVERNKRGGWSLGPADYYDDHGASELFNPLPDYFGDITSAWEVVNHFNSKGYRVTLFNRTPADNGWLCCIEIEDGDLGSKKAFVKESTASRAICFAAIKIMETK